MWVRFLFLLSLLFLSELAWKQITIYCGKISAWFTISNDDVSKKSETIFMIMTDSQIICQQARLLSLQFKLVLLFLVVLLPFMTRNRIR